MTALMVAVLDNAVVVYSDGAIHNRSGIVVGFRQKADIELHLPAIIASRGSGIAGLSLRSLMVAFGTFDQAVESLAQVMPIAAADGVHHGDDVNLSAMLAGWSEARQRWEAWNCWLRGNDLDHLVDGSLQLEQVPRFLADPFPDEERLNASGMLTDGRLQFDLTNDGDFITFMEAIRKTPFPVGPGPDAPVGCIVGGFIQKTTLTRDRAETVIIHRWDDEEGRPMSPSDETR